MTTDENAPARPVDGSLDTTGAPDRSDETANINTLPPELKSLIMEMIQEVDENELQDEDDVDYDTEEEDALEETGEVSTEGGALNGNEKELATLEIDERSRIEYHPTQHQSQGLAQYAATRNITDIVQAEEILRDMSKEDYGKLVEEYHESARAMLDARLMNTSAMGCMAAVSSEWAALAFPYLWRSVDFEGQNNDSVRWFIDHILPRHAQRIEGIWFRTSIAENNIYDDDQSSSDSEDEETPNEVNEQGEEIYGFNHPPAKTNSSARTAAKWGEPERRALFGNILSKLPSLVDIDMDMTGPIEGLADDPEEAGEHHDFETTIANAFVYDSPLPPRLETFALTCPDGNFLSAFFLGNLFFARFDNLRSLTLDGVDNNDSAHLLLKRIGSMSKLEELALSNAEFLAELGEEGVMSHFTDTHSLRRLALEDCGRLSLPAFVEFISLFPNLALLDLDESHCADNEEDNKKILDDGKPFSLPSLQHLVVSTFHSVNFYRAFDTCRLETLELGYNPSLEYEELEAFIVAHQTTLKSVLINSVSNLSRSQCESMELLLYAKKIECKIEEPESDSEGEEDFDEHEHGWEHEGDFTDLESDTEDDEE